MSDNRKNKKSSSSLGKATFGPKHSAKTGHMKSYSDKTMPSGDFPDCVLTSDEYGLCDSIRQSISESDDGMPTADFIEKLYKSIMALADEGKLNLNPAKVGIGLASTAMIWDVEILRRLLTSAGYCSGCIDLFIDRLGSNIDSDGVVENIVICSMADIAVDFNTMNFESRHR